MEKKFHYPLDRFSILRNFSRNSLYFYSIKKTKLRFINFSYLAFLFAEDENSKEIRGLQKKETKNNHAYLINVLFSHSFTDNTFTSFRTQTFIGIDKFSWPDEFDKFPPRRDI